MATYYLDFSSSLDGANDGSYGNPWASFSEVGTNQVLAEGDVVSIVNGGSVAGQTINNSTSGIIYRGLGVSRTELDFGTSTIDASNNANSVFVEGISFKTGNASNVFDGNLNFTGTFTFKESKIVSTATSQQTQGVRSSTSGVFVFNSCSLSFPLGFSAAFTNQGWAILDQCTLNLGPTATYAAGVGGYYNTINNSFVYSESVIQFTGGVIPIPMNNSYHSSSITPSGSGNTDYGSNPLLADKDNNNLLFLPTNPIITSTSATGTNIPSDAIWVKVSGIATIDGTEGEETNPYGFSEWATVISDANLTTSKSVVFSDGTYTFGAEFSNAYNITDLTFYGETRSGVTLTDGGGRLSGNGGGQNCRLRNLTIEALDHFFFNYTIELDATEVTFLITKYILVSGSNHVFRACVFRVTFSGTSGAWCLSGNTHFTNCTFIDLFGARSSVLTGGSLTNCIIYASLGTQIITMTTPPDESNTIFGIASGFGTANTSNPRFTDPENNNLTLSPRSPLITSTSTGIPTDAVWIKASGTATVDGTEGQQTNAYGLSELTTAETTASGRTSKTVVFKGEDFSTNAVIRLNTGNTDGMTYLAESDLTIFKATGETARFQVNSESAVKSTLKGITFKDYRTTSGNTYTARVGSDNNSTSLDNAGKVSWISCKFLDFSVTAGFSEIVFGITGTTNPANHCYNECVGCEFSFLSTASQQGGVLGGQNNSKHRMDATGCTFYVKAGTSLTLFISNNNIPEYHLKSCIFYMESGTQVHYYYAALTHSSDGCTYFNSPSQNFTGVTNYRTDDPLLVDKENNNFILSPKSPLLQ